MKRIILGLLLLVSISNAENGREQGYRIMLEAKKLYKIDAEKNTCKEVTEIKDKLIEPWNNNSEIYKILSPMGLLRFISIDTTQYKEGNGKYIFIQATHQIMDSKGGYNILMVENKNFCENIAKNTDTVNSIIGGFQKNATK